MRAKTYCERINLGMKSRVGIFFREKGLIVKIRRTTLTCDVKYIVKYIDSSSGTSVHYRYT